MRQLIAVAAAAVLLACSEAPPAAAQSAASDLAQWNRILTAYYNPAKGLDYKALKARDAAALEGELVAGP